MKAELLNLIEKLYNHPQIRDLDLQFLRILGDLVDTLDE